MSDNENAAKAAIYARFSGAEPGASAERQMKACADYAEATGLGIAGKFVDATNSRQQERPALARLLEEARSGKFDAIIVEDLARLSREPMTSLNIRSQIEAGGAFVSGPWDVSVADRQRREVIARCKRGREAAKHRRAAQNGIRPAFTYGPGPKPKVARRVGHAVRKLYDIACDAGGSPEKMSELLSDLIRAVAAAQQRQELAK